MCMGFSRLRAFLLSCVGIALNFQEVTKVEREELGSWYLVLTMFLGPRPLSSSLGEKDWTVHW